MRNVALIVLSLLAATCGTDGGDTGPPDPSTTAPTTTAAPTITAATGTTPTTTTGEPAPWDPPVHRIAIDNGQFVDTGTGEPFIARGANYVKFQAGADRTLDPLWFHEEEVNADFAALEERGWNTVRIFLDSCQCNARHDGISTGWLDTVAAVLEIAAAHDLVVVLTSNDLPDRRYGSAANAGASDLIAGYRNAHMLTAAGHTAFVDYWTDILDGLVARQARLDVVLGWSILNEQWLFGAQPPLSLTEGTVNTRTGPYDPADGPSEVRTMVADNLTALIDDVATVVKERDPHGLVTMGFFAPQFPVPTDIGGDRFVDTAPLIGSALDFLDFHAYPGVGLSVEQQAENFGLPADKPVLLGEVGAFTDIYPDAESAALAVQHWIADSCAVGWDGWLYWAFDQLEGVGDAAWGLTDADGLLLDELSPLHQPDPCTTTLVDPNVALTATATASRSLDEEPPANAIDGRPGTQWGAGADAPQWIELQFAEPTEVAEILLHVAQFPDGPTTHIVELRFAEGGTPITETLSGDTVPGDLLTVVFDEPLGDVATIRVTTTASVSWVAWTEIEVLTAG